jgi:hypothetical protein
MPNYDYHCPANGRTVNVRHSMLDGCLNWADVCERTGEPLGDTSPEAPVERLLHGGFLKVRRRRGANAAGPVSHTGSCCGVQGCGSH